MIKVFLRKFMGLLDSRSNYEILLAPFNEELAQKIEDRFKVSITETPDHRMIKVVGGHHREATQEYMKISRVSN